MPVWIPKTMKITMCQSRGQADDPEANYAKMKMIVGNVDSDIFVFPEMFLCGYVGSRDKMHLRTVEERIVGKFKEYSKKRECAIVCGGPLTDAGKVYNAAYFINGDDIRTYRKIHLSSDGIVDEKGLYFAGHEPLTIDHKGMRFGLAVSRDLFFPDLFRYYAENDVDMVICISASPDKATRHYEKLIAARALENSMHLIFVNMVGPDPGEMMVGRSRWVSPEGETVEACTESSDVRQLRIDDAAVKNAKNGRPVMQR